MKRRFIQCDVFTSIPCRGNGLAVVIDSQGLSDAEMQRFAAWTNLAETTFLFPPENFTADYKVRIFTPTREMPFAGHPTLGSCAVWLRAGGIPSTHSVVKQECGVGIVDIDMTGPVPRFVAPPTVVDNLPPANLNKIISALAIDPARVIRKARLDNGPIWQVLELQTAADVLAVDSSSVRWPEFKPIGLIGAYPDGADCDYEVRMLAPSSGMSEDPITGSLNAAIACWAQSEGRLKRHTLVSQGTTIGRTGRVHITIGDGKVLIGGATQILIEGVLEL